MGESMVDRTNIFAPSRRGRLLALFYSILAVQAVAVLILLNPWVAGDTDVYIRLAKSIDQGFYGEVLNGSYAPDPLRPPGYPLILWVILDFLNLPVLAAAFTNILAYLGSVYLTGRFIGRISPKTELAFLGLLLVYPMPAIYSSFIMTEAPVLFGLSLLVVLLARVDGLNITVLAIGFVTGASVLIRSDLLFLPLLVAAIAATRSFLSDWILRRAIAIGSAILIVCGIVMLPYTVWNYHNFGKASPIPVASAVGSSLYIATWQGKLPLDDINAVWHGKITPRAKSAGLESELTDINQRLGLPPRTAPWNPAVYPTLRTRIDSQQLILRIALDRIAADPLHYATHVANNGWRLWVTSNYPESVPVPVQWALTVISILILLAGVAGCIAAVRRAAPWPVPIYPALMLLYVPAIHVWLHTEARYTAAVRLILVAYAAVFVMMCASKLRRRRVPAR